MAELTPLYMDINNVYSGDELGLPFRDLITEGTVGAADLAVTQRAAGANLSVDIAAGACWVAGDTNTTRQPTYRCTNDATVNKGVTPDPSNPRKVLVVAQITDDAFAGTGKNWAITLIHGTPAATPTEPALPPSALPLALIDVTAADTDITTGQITDRRVRASVPGQLTGGGGGGTAGAIPVDLRNPSVGSNPGNCFPSVTSLTGWEEWHWEFVKDVDGVLYGMVKAPASAPTASKVVLSTLYNATSGISRWYVSWASFADGVTANPASLTTIAAQDVTVPATARLRKDITFTLGSQPAANDLIIIGIVHNGIHANDTVAVNSELLGAWFLPS